MNIALWILAAVLAAAFATGAATQILLPLERYRSLHPSQHWAEDFGPGHLKAIGTLKLFGAIGLVLPPLVGIAPVLSPLAAVGLMLFMAGAATTRFRRSEWSNMAVDVMFLAAFAVLAWGRLMHTPFVA